MTEELMEKVETVAPFEVLLVDEYAERLKVGKSTIFYWKEKGVLKPGRHYFQTGKVLRFIWSLKIIMELHCMPKESKESTNIKEKGLHKPREKAKRPRQTAGINLDY